MYLYVFRVECEKFKSQLMGYADRILVNYIVDGAVSQVNIDAVMRKKIEKEIQMEGNVSVFSFDTAQKEIYKVLVQNNYHAFIRSDICADYVKQKRNERIQSHIEGVSDKIPEGDM